jgi:hypothetical protein
MQDTANQVVAMKAANKQLKVAFKSKVSNRSQSTHRLPPHLRAWREAGMLAWRGTGSVTQDLDVNRIEAMQDEMSDLMEQSNEIQDVLGRNYSVPDDLDEEARKALPIDNRIVWGDFEWFEGMVLASTLARCTACGVATTCT